MQYGYLQTMYKMPKSKVNKIHNDAELIEIICKAFTAKNAKNFISFSGLSLDEVSKMLPVSKRTLQRNLSNMKNKLDLLISEVFIELGEIYKIGLQAFDGDKKRFNKYLDTENPYFNNKKPMEIMNTHIGRELVKYELLRIEYSEFS